MTQPKNKSQEMNVGNDDVLSLLQAHEKKAKRNRESDSDSDDSVEEIKKPNMQPIVPPTMSIKTPLLGEKFRHYSYNISFYFSSII